jgi:hypothetical protein
MSELRLEYAPAGALCHSKELYLKFQRGLAKVQWPRLTAKAAKAGFLEADATLHAATAGG